MTQAATLNETLEFGLFVDEVMPQLLHTQETQ